jgi:hypothetical protein
VDRFFRLLAFGRQAKLLDEELNNKWQSQTKPRKAAKAAPVVSSKKKTDSTPEPEPIPEPSREPATATKGPSEREGTKKALVLSLLQRPGGVTRTELAQATGWTGPFVHGFILWTVIKKVGLPVVSTKDESGERTYTLQS